MAKYLYSVLVASFYFLNAILLAEETSSQLDSIDDLTPLTCALSKKDCGFPFHGRKPNIIVILTDQERYPTHWPKGWAKDNLPAMQKLKKHGLTFRRAYAAASQCSPSRAVLLTSEYYPTNGIAVAPALEHPVLPSDQQLTNIASLLREKTCYDVVWKGKWHLSLAVNGGENWSEQDIPYLRQNYGMAEWNPPDAGNLELVEGPITLPEVLSTLGGGFAKNDNRFVQGPLLDPLATPGFGESILSYLIRVASTPRKDRKPFCLFISLVNPHDVWVYPNDWLEAGYDKNVFANMGISLPSNYVDSLTTKPSVQLEALNAFNVVSPFQDGETPEVYVNFYAYLHKVVDQQVGTVLKALDLLNLTNETIIIRTADHGELGLSHGMREKAYTVYEEMIHVPLIISNPIMYPYPQTTDSFYSHVDLLPTIAELARVPHFSKYGRGVSIVPILKNPLVTVQDSILFAYDDSFVLPPDVPGGHIRAIREDDWTYAVYYSEDGSDFEYEMYNLKTDRGQLNNLLYQVSNPKIIKKARQLHCKLKKKIDHAHALPAGFPWPNPPHYDIK